ncbi:lytic transglycosylase [Marinitoga sp. 1135]|uniref:Soluble lytic murein transglycosylase-like protein n=1 Tax=Marinitoga piezophila (strain DSM 14283 / JCM 11233 / KA3) TaxID=443254 RepID=H2J649_MARPK|nr:MULTISPECIES: transglycosylase SLT domain-containing protein [Marinitoga]AEX85110.1 soluble lytic murein transglycosylase-like protein [Marinitoga piezophila KA3]APT75612.1 lytic transglycosylase [Marinitoga sp. 1137]NUU95322.1 lytic transglycosylase [Marinitoga sp. 1135]NUU97256.1 lytic transglycosylase [Marinitoga sp. 1138]
MFIKKHLIIILILVVSILNFGNDKNYNLTNETNLKIFLMDFMNREYKLTTGKELKPERKVALAEGILLASKEFNISPILIASIIDIETSFRNVIGKYGEIGYMQIRAETAKYIIEMYYDRFEKYGYKSTDLKWIKDRLLFDPKYNILVGTAYLSYLQEIHGDITHAVGWYNGGGNSYYLEKVVFKIAQITIEYPII